MIEYASSDVTQLVHLESWLRERSANIVRVAVAKLSQTQNRYLDDEPAKSEERRPPLNVICAVAIDRTNNTSSYCFDSLLPRSQQQQPPRNIDLELPSLLAILPPPLPQLLQARFAVQKSPLVEILLSQYRAPVLRFDDGSEDDLIGAESSSPALLDKSLELLLAGKKLEQIFSVDNRAGLPGALHLISATKDRSGSVIALTYRVGRHIAGTAELIRDLVASVGSQQSMLLLGPPGVGKTTLLRDIARLLADELKRRVVVVDTSNEIAGDHPKPHPCIGRAHRMPVADRRRQHEVLIEAVQNQNPQVIVVDEIGTTEEVTAAQTITQRGVGLVYNFCVCALLNIKLSC